MIACFALLSALTVWCWLTIVSPSFALKTGRGSDFSLGGSATVVHPGNGSTTAAQLSAIGPTGESHVNIAIPKGLKLRELTALATDYKFVVGTCGSGSPRFTANVTDGTLQRSVFFYIGAPPSTCAGGTYAYSGNLAAPSSIVDAHDLPGGTSEPFSAIQAKYGKYAVTAVHIDVDGGEGGNQTVDFDNTVVNGKFVSYEPEHGISVLMERTAGRVKVKEPGEPDFKNLKKVESIHVNSVVDTRGGKIEVTAATGDYAETTPDSPMTFYDGLIRLRQGHGHNARATAKLLGKLQCPRQSRAESRAGKSSGPVATTSRKRRRRVWGSGSGNYATAGKGGTGSVLGTTWLTKDTCQGTLFKVIEGIGVAVHDFGLDRHIQIGPGQKYFARNR